ncbi:MAG: hypothetical protein ABI836_04635 [Gemmatimonadota bacterium]
MPTIFERLNTELESFGRKAQAAIDEGRFHIELIRLRRQRDEAACNLGRLVHKRERGGEVEQVRIDSLMLRLDDVEAAIDKVEKQMGSVRAEAAEEKAAPEPGEPVATTAEAGVAEGSPS